MNNKYKNILFDLDGTITDSKPGIINSLVFSLKNMKREIPPEEELVSVIGIPLQKVFSHHFLFNEEETVKAVGYFRQYYGEKGIYENNLYSGMEDLLKLLSSGSALYIATSKLEKFARMVLHHYHIDHFFRGVIGADPGGAEADKTYLIKKVMKTYCLEPGSLSAMVGDTFFDIEAARNCGIHSVWVTYGYGDKEKTMLSQPDFIAGNVHELYTILK